MLLKEFNADKNLELRFKKFFLEQKSKCLINKPKEVEMLFIKEEILSSGIEIIEWKKGNIELQFGGFSDEEIAKLGIYLKIKKKYSSILFNKGNYQLFNRKMW